MVDLWHASRSCKGWTDYAGVCSSECKSALSAWIWVNEDEDLAEDFKVSDPAPAPANLSAAKKGIRKFRLVNPSSGSDSCRSSDTRRVRFKERDSKSDSD